MENVVQGNTGVVAPFPIKKGRGRPRKHPVQDQTDIKRGRGRPRKHPISTETVVKRGRGRPRKYPILEKERLPNGELKPSFKKVDTAHLLKHMLNYFTKLLIIHSKMAIDNQQFEKVFQRLKQLDFQMAEICRTVLKGEFAPAEGEEQEEAA